MGYPGALKAKFQDGSPARLAAAVHLTWAFVTLLTVYAKYKTIDFFVAARSLGRVEQHDPLTRAAIDGLTRWEKLSFFREDILLGLLLIPMVLTLAGICLPRGWRIYLLGGISLLATLLVYAQFRAFTQLGRFISYHMFYAAAAWSWHESAFRAYAQQEHAVVLVVGAMVCGGLTWTAARLYRRRPRQLTANRLSAMPAIAVGCAIAVASLLPWLPRIPSTLFHRSTLLSALRALWNDGEVDTSEFRPLSAVELGTRYRLLAQAPPPQAVPQYWGTEQSNNIIFFILETAPAAVLPLNGDLADFPNLRRLRDKSFVALQHHSTYPYTSRALFSIFSSWYDSSLAKSFTEQHPDMVVPGILQSLSSRGYVAAVYSPSHAYHEDDDKMFTNMGVKRMVVPDASLVRAGTGKEGRMAFQSRMARDLAALALLKRDLDQFLEERKQFVAVFLPQLSHAPWFDDLQEPHTHAERLARGRELLAMQDTWLGELLTVLERHQQLEHTMIVVTGDHGVRSRYEDPSFTGGMLDQYSFHVPLLIYAPQTLRQPTTIPWLTSHIDIAPSVLDLLGISTDRDFEQGTGIWHSEIQQRKTFFFADAWLGADGFHSGGHYCMWNHITGSVYVSPQEHFAIDNLVPEASAPAQETRRCLTRMIGLQQVWAARFSRSASLRSRMYGRQD